MVAIKDTGSLEQFIMQCICNCTGIFMQLSPVHLLYNELHVYVHRLLQHFWSTGKDTALRQRPTGHRLRPAPSSIMARPPRRTSLRHLEHDRSNLETGERRDIYTLTFSNRL